jgi:membrane-associated phospholipid phosphatase
MQTLFENSIAFIIALQNLGNWLVAPMIFFSNLGTENFFFLVLPLIYWSIDPTIGLLAGFILVSSEMVNYTGKLLFAGPRPYWMSSHVKGLWPETTFGAPSGHAQNAMSFWGIIAVYLRKPWAWIVAGFMIFMIGSSRLFLGAHFPHDILIGWAIGGLLLFAFARFWKPATAWLAKKTASQQILIAFLVSLIFILIGFSTATYRKGFRVPDQWISNALLAGPQAPAPVDPSGIFSSAGTLFGLAIGAVWIRQNGGYQVSGPIWKRAGRYLIGLIGVLIFWMGLGAVLPRGDGYIYYFLRFLRYTLVGFWVSGGAPWIFKRIKLAERTESSI